MKPEVESKPLAVMALTILGTATAEIPAIERLLIRFTDHHPHLAVLTDGTIGLILLIIATAKSHKQRGAK